MKRKRFSVEQIVAVLKQAEVGGRSHISAGLLFGGQVSHYLNVILMCGNCHVRDARQTLGGVRGGVCGVDSDLGFRYCLS